MSTIPKKFLASRLFGVLTMLPTAENALSASGSLLTASGPFG
jgi:hypothetical protein